MGPSPSMSRSLNTTSLSGVLTCAGTWVSPSITWFVREWCTACERCHEKYGTRATSGGCIPRCPDGAVGREAPAAVRHDPAPGTGGPGDEGVRDPRGEVGERHGDVQRQAEADGDGGGNSGVHEDGGVLDEAVLGDLVQYLGHGGKPLLLRVERLAVHAGVVLLRRGGVTRRGRDGAGGDRRGRRRRATRGATGAWRDPEGDATGGGLIACGDEGGGEVGDECRSTRRARAATRG